LALHFGVPATAVIGLASEARRLQEAAARQLASMWELSFTMDVPAYQVASIESKTMMLAHSNSTIGSFTSILKTQLIAAGATSSSVSSLQLAGFMAARVTTTTTATTTTTEGIYLFTGSISINATSVTIHQMEIAVKATLAFHFVVTLTEVDVSVGGWVASYTQLAEPDLVVWSIFYTIRAQGMTKATIIKYKTILLNNRDAAATTAFARTVGLQLVTAGAAYQLLQFSSFMGTGDVMTSTPGTVNSTTTVPMGITSSLSERRFLSIGIITIIAFMLYGR